MINIKNLSKKYGDRTVLDGADYCFPEKGIVCLLGASGSGKSTLFNILAGLDSDYSGEVSVCGESLSKLNADELCAYRRDNIGLVFQDYNLLKGYSAIENITLPLLGSGEPLEISSRAAELMEKLGIGGKAEQKTENLSGGQKQRVAIARAIINNPSIILADEPTGALDRKNAMEIMKLLKEISEEKLVIVITHDKKLCDYADEIISIVDGKIITEGATIERKITSTTLKKREKSNIPTFSIALKNFKIKLGRYSAVAIAIAFAITCFMFSLSAGNITDRGILSFQEKNSAFNNGFIKALGNADDFELLSNDGRLTNVFRQYVINDITLTIGDKTEKMEEKYPIPKATESMSYGVMPRIGKFEISLTPSIAKKFSNKINELIGKTLTLNYNGKNYELKVSGIFNTSHDDFFVSSDIEKTFYENMSGVGYSVSYDVILFDDIVSVSEELVGKNIVSRNAALEVATLCKTFKTLETLFMSLSIVLLFAGLAIGIIMLVKMQNSRYSELGLLAALGLNRITVLKMIVSENLLLAAMSVIINAVLSGIAFGICAALRSAVVISPLQLVLSFIMTAVAVIAISVIAAFKLIRTEPAAALRK